MYAKLIDFDVYRIYLVDVHTHLYHTYYILVSSSLQLQRLSIDLTMPTTPRVNPKNLANNQRTANTKWSLNDLAKYKEYR